MADYFLTEINDCEKPQFAASVEGLLLDRNNELAINLFIAGISAKKKENSPYYIKSDLQFSKIGMIRDKLMTKVHDVPIFIVSKQFKDFLSKECNNYVEFYDVEFDYVNNKPLNNYFICNLIQKIDCTDYKESILDFNFYNVDNEGYGGIYTIDSLVIDKSKIPTGIDIFLLGNIKFPIIVMSKRIKEKMGNEGITGFKFVAPEDFMI